MGREPPAAPRRHPLLVPRREPQPRLMPVPLFDTATPLEPLRDEIRARVSDVLDQGRYILGPEVAAFEEDFATYLGAKHAIGVANGTDAITIGLQALGVRPGDDVV